MLNRWRVALILLLPMTSAVVAQTPDPRDSVILESRTILAPQAGTGGAVRLKVYITNKDTVVFLGLNVRQTTTAGAAYMTLAYPRSFSGVVEPLANTLNCIRLANFPGYDGVSPDSFSVRAGYCPTPENPRAGAEPPNAVRKAVWELKFDTVLAQVGTVEFEQIYLGQATGFAVIQYPGPAVVDVPVNLAKGVVTVQLKGDLDLNGEVRPSDVAQEIICVALGQAPPAGYAACDLNCNGSVTVTDISIMLLFKFAGVPWPCI